MIEIEYAAKDIPESFSADRKTEQPDVTAAVAGILQGVKQRGDEALRAYTLQFDGADIKNFCVPQEDVEAAKAQVGEEFLGVLQRAAGNIKAFHQKQVRQGFVAAEKTGIVMGQRVLPLARVGLYVPGGTAPYPSTVLMTAIPAQIAGVKRIVMVTPPGKDGKVDAGILAAASVAGVTDIYRVGGAQAVAALAFGTQSIPRVDKIVGPGNLYVATAKRMVYGTVDIDMIAGPSDILVVADNSANPAWVAADMLGQAEHDPLAAAVLVTTSETLAKQVQQQLAAQLPKLERAEVAGQSLHNNGRIIVVQNMQAALGVANAFAPEHLELCVEQPFALLGEVQNAGSIFLGHHTPEALGDYFAGPNHTLPTEGTARFSSPLSVDDFVKKSSYLYYTAQSLAAAGPDVVSFAQREGLGAHANSVCIRLDR